MKTQKPQTPNVMKENSSRTLHQLYFELGKVLATQGRTLEARAILERSLDEIQPAPLDLALDIRLYLAQVCEQMQDYSSAFHIYLETVLQQPDHLNELMFDADRLLTSNLVVTEQSWLCDQWAVAINQMQLSAEDRAIVDFFLGRVGTYLQRYDWAGKWFEQATKDAPGNAKAFEGLGKSLLATGQAEPAISALQRARELAKQGNFPERSGSIEKKLAQAFVDAKRYPEALAQIESCLSNYPDYRYELLLIRSQSYLFMGNFEAALREAEIAAQVCPNAAAPDILRARALIALNEYASAEASADQAQKKYPLNAEAAFYEIQAMIENQQVSLRRVETLLRRYIKRLGYKSLLEQTQSPALDARDTDWHAHYFVARLYHMLLVHFSQKESDDNSIKSDISPSKKELLQRALNEVDRAIELQPEDDLDFTYPEASLQRLKALLLKDLGEHEAAAELFYEAGRRYGWRNHYRLAIDMLKNAQELRPNHALTYWELSDVLRMQSFEADNEDDRQQLLDESLAVWNQGIQIELPTGGESSWAYISRVLINEQLADCSSNVRRDLEWESIVYLERAILNYQQDPYRWTYLGCCHNRLGNYANALDATDQALTQEPENLAAIEEQTLIFMKMGRFSEAKALIDQHQQITQGSDEWADTVEPHLLLYLGQLEIAQARLASLLTEETDDPWYYVLQALCDRKMGHFQQAHQSEEWLYRHYQQKNIDTLIPEDWIRYAWAAYHLGDLDKATEILEQAYQSWGEESGEVLQKIGVCYLQRGDWELGASKLKEGISKAHGALELENLLMIDLPELERSVAKAPYAKQVHNILKQAKKCIQSRRSMIKNPGSATAELEQWLTQLGTAESVGSWAWIAANAGLARLYAKSDRWEKAISIYETLQQFPDLFPEAKIGLQTICFKEQIPQNS
jgi:tetratricopeptide (TPR) repeat protein